MRIRTDMKEKRTVTCRYGVEYIQEFCGTRAAIERSFALMARCCCWVCHNHECKEPHNEVIPDCGNACELWTKTPYCVQK